jgi:hypothetical protein
MVLGVWVYSYERGTPATLFPDRSASLVEQRGIQSLPDRLDAQLILRTALHRGGEFSEDFRPKSKSKFV